MNCSEIQERLVDLIVGDIDPEEKETMINHINQCPACAEEFQFLSHCLDVCCSWPDFEEDEMYWEEFLISVHEQISLTKPKSPFPFRIVLPVAASALGAIGIIYFLFFKPAQKEVAQHEPAEINRDPVYEVYELTPEEQQEFIKMVNQKYFGE